MIDEQPFLRRVNDDPVTAPSGVAPQPVILTGRRVRLEPLDLDRHVGALYRAGHESEAARQSWAYLPWGPFADEAALLELLRKLGGAAGNVFFAICDAVSGGVVGMAAYWDSQPAFGVTEIAVVWFAPAFQRTPGATEAMFLMLAYAMDALGYRRVQWRCNAMNAKSRSAAKRLGFRFEGVFFGNMVSKGRNRDTAWYSILDSEWPALKATIEAWLDPSNFDAQGSQRRSLSAMTAAR
jgi:RimJ/RimL family protein N-acetyltransferase